MQAFYIPASMGQRFCLLHEPSEGQVCRGAVLYIHPIAEEMNRCRRMAGLQARALARHGYAVLQMDLLGCGDSTGDFGDASWDIWLDDVKCARNWLTERYQAPLWLWGMRAGCLLLTASLERIPNAGTRLLLWQPVESGKQHLQQMLRLRQMADVMQGGAKQSVQDMMESLAQGQSVEVAGYTISPALAHGLAGATLEGLQAANSVVCMEVVADAQMGAQAPTMADALQRCRDSGVDVHCEVVEGEAFWLLPEAATCDALVDATLAVLQSA